MKRTGIMTFFYGLIIFLGGIIGHIKNGSQASLYSGAIFGLMLLASSLAIYFKKKFGLYFALLLSFLLDAFFTWRFAQTLKFIPAGLLSLISLAMVIVLALRIRKIFQTR